ncbi:MAG TPA: L-rhamnose/proton symporter RhaT [Terriglobia bacterium]|nr:L-rhamnose/proton symporter RhaT [Terriglobia bacterium]
MTASLMLVLLAGVMNGSFATPMKRVRGWQWENTWLIWSFLGMVIIPLIVATATVPGLFGAYSAAGPAALIRTAAYGMVWGVSAILFGLGVTRVGVALGFAMILGTSASLGAILPLVRLHREQILATAGLTTLVGVGIILAGVVACARAGVLRESNRSERSAEKYFAAGILICVLSGIGSSFMSLALNESSQIYRAAEALGTPAAQSLNSVWPILLGGAFVVNAAYCAFQLIRVGGFARFRNASAFNAGLVLVMALLWSGSNFVYSAGARGLGPLGLILGWPIFMAAIVLTANAWGLLSGEWKAAGTDSAVWGVAGTVLLIAGIVAVASVGRLT